jgi:hypothetical protein
LRRRELDGGCAFAESPGVGGAVVAVFDDGVELKGFAELDAVVGGAIVFRVVVEERGEGLFGLGAVAGGSAEVTGERTDLGAGDVGDGDCGTVRGAFGVGGEGLNEIDGLACEEVGLRQVGGFFAVGDEDEDDVVEGGGVGFELKAGREVRGHVEGLAAGFESGGGPGGFGGLGELLAVGLEGLELHIDLLVGVGRKLFEREVDAGGDDGGGGFAMREDGPVGGAGVGVDGGLAEGFGTGERLDGGDATGGVDVDLKLDGALDAGLAGVGGVDDGGDGEGLVLNGSWGLCGLERGEKKGGSEDHVCGGLRWLGYSGIVD